MDTKVPPDHTEPAPEFPVLHQEALKSPANVEFLTFLGHELRTPLSSILGYAELMYDSHQTSTQRLSCIGKIREQVKDITNLLKGLTDLSQLESGGFQFQHTRFSLKEELAQTLYFLRSQAWKKRLRLELGAEGALPSEIVSDPARLRELLGQVVGYSLETLSRGGLQITWRLRPPLAGAHVPLLEFQIEELGVGLSSATAGLSPEPLLDAPSWPHQHPVGFALSKRLAQALGGDIVELPRKTGKNGRLRVTVAAEEVPDTPLIENFSWEALKEAQPTPLTAVRHDLTGLHILVVDDSPDTQALISHFLTQSGARVELAPNGLEAWRKASRSAFDLVFMDIELPLLDGYEVTARLRKEGIHAPIIALTAHAMESVKEKCLASGCTDYLTKPLGREALLEVAGRYAIKTNGKTTQENFAKDG